MTKSRRVLWFPPHPAEGSFSMHRYWASLKQAADRVGGEDFYCPYGNQKFSPPSFSRWRRVLGRYFLAPAAVRINCRSAALVHILDHSSAYLLNHIPAGVPSVVTVHDLLPLYPESSLSPMQRGRFAACVANLTKATRLISVSEFTKQDIQRLLNIPGDKITVIPNGVDQFSDDTRRIWEVGPGLGDQVKILSVGSVLSRKNLKIFPVVCRILREMGLVPAIHRVGKRLDPELARQISQQATLVEHVSASDETLASLYKNCDVLLFPSWLEGFGLPVLEAMAHGCAVVCSNATSLPEAGGDAALYFDPADPGEAAKQIARLIRDPSLREHLREAGMSRAREFTWDRHLTGCRAVYAAAGYTG